MYSRPDGAGHAVDPARRLPFHRGGHGRAAGPGRVAAWGAEPIPVDTLYDTLAADGLVDGPAFRGLRAAWRRGGEVFADITPDQGASLQAGRFNFHPALLDAALHAIGLCDESQVSLGLPFAWSGVELHATGATRLRARLTPARDGTVSITLADPAGRPVATVESLLLRPFTAAPGLRGAARARHPVGLGLAPAP